MFISPTSCLSSPCYLPLLLHFFLLSQIFRGLSHLSVLSCPPHTVSCLLHGDTTRMSSTSFFTDLAVIFLAESNYDVFNWGVDIPDRSQRPSGRQKCCCFPFGRDTHTHTVCLLVFIAILTVILLCPFKWFHEWSLCFSESSQKYLMPPVSRATLSCNRCVEMSPNNVAISPV